MPMRPDQARRAARIAVEDNVANPGRAGTNKCRDTHFLIHRCQLILVPQIGVVTDAADDHVGPVLMTERGRQPRPRRHRHIAPVRREPAAKSHQPLLLRRSWLLIAVHRHEHSDSIE
jgi:hypothetical protein